MRAIAILLALGAACASTRTSPCYKGLGADAAQFVARSAPQATWTTRLRTEAPAAATPRLPGTQVLAFETDRTLDEKEAGELLDRVEFEVVRSLYGGQAKLVSRKEHPAQPSVRGVTWEYDADGRHGFITFFGVRRDPGYEVIFTVCELGWMS